MFIISFEGSLLLFFIMVPLNIFNLRLRNAFILTCLGNFCYQNISPESAFLNYFYQYSATKNLLSGTVGRIIVVTSTFLGNKWPNIYNWKRSTCRKKQTNAILHLIKWKSFYIITYISLGLPHVELKDIGK